MIQVFLNDLLQLGEKAQYRAELQRLYSDIFLVVQEVVYMLMTATRLAVYGMKATKVSHLSATPIVSQSIFILSSECVAGGSTVSHV